MIHYCHYIKKFLRFHIFITCAVFATPVAKKSSSHSNINAFLVPEEITYATDWFIMTYAKV
jgi:hypothetical protein